MGGHTRASDRCLGIPPHTPELKVQKIKRNVCRAPSQPRPAQALATAEVSPGSGVEAPVKTGLPCTACNIVRLEIRRSMPDVHVQVCCRGCSSDLQAEALDSGIPTLRSPPAMV